MVCAQLWDELWDAVWRGPGIPKGGWQVRAGEMAGGGGLNSQSPVRARKLLLPQIEKSVIIRRLTQVS